MLKKISIYIILIIMITGCNNQENKTISLCVQLEKDIQNYQSNKIERTELYSKLEDYRIKCINSTTNLCITLNAIIIIPKEQTETRELFIKDLLNQCNKK